ncbi:hypothetical protein B0H67DRAFT_360756 [Lasiosphaeris hirsuta]|uniref:Uncharacterized protein n=1 Tax=Lasiosphaeris hirsuta TaxID=260670 RepID=A0AA39ZW70_9PEZI|nr:hypothetical protein B0H67DRAFT_360756 [Lasiosphaeris hirsuta]
MIRKPRAGLVSRIHIRMQRRRCHHSGDARRSMSSLLRGAIPAEWDKHGWCRLALAQAASVKRARAGRQGILCLAFGWGQRLGSKRNLGGLRCSRTERQAARAFLIPRFLCLRFPAPTSQYNFCLQHPNLSATWIIYPFTSFSCPTNNFQFTISMWRQGWVLEIPGLSTVRSPIRRRNDLASIRSKTAARNRFMQPIADQTDGRPASGQRDRPTATARRLITPKHARTPVISHRAALYIGTPTCNVVLEENTSSTWAVGISFSFRYIATTCLRPFLQMGTANTRDARASPPPLRAEWESVRSCTFLLWASQRAPSRPGCGASIL